MSEHLRLLDQALALGEQELAWLKAGETDESQAMAQERHRLIQQGCVGLDPVTAPLAREKLRRLLDQQHQLSQEAAQQRDALREQLKDTRQQTTRFSGYARAARPRPIASRFLSKQG